MNIKKHIPNAITLGNLTAGLIALVYAFDNNIQMTFLWVCIGIFLDFWDGFLARKFNVAGPLGVQLDSMADMVTSGVVPGVVMFKLLEQITQSYSYNLSSENFYMGIIPFLGFVISVASGYRLANFNIDTRQANSFIGLPTPANALFIVSIPLILEQTGGEGFFFNWFSSVWVLVFISFLSAFMLNANIPLFSLKIKANPWKENKAAVLFVLFSVLLLLVLQVTAIPFIIISYVLLSGVLNVLGNNAKV